MYVDFFIKIDCFCTYNIKINRKSEKFNTRGGGVFPLRQVKYALRANVKYLKVILTS